MADFQAIYEALDRPDGIGCHNCVRGIASRLVMPLGVPFFYSGFSHNIVV